MKSGDLYTRYNNFLKSKDVVNAFLGNHAFYIDIYNDLYGTYNPFDVDEDGYKYMNEEETYPMGNIEDID